MNQSNNYKKYLIKRMRRWLSDLLLQPCRESQSLLFHFHSTTSRPKLWRWKQVIQHINSDSQGNLPYKGFIDCFAKSIKNEGVLGMWVGLPTFYSRMAPHAMITVLLQDFFHDVLTKKVVAHWSKWCLQEYIIKKNIWIT